MCFFLGNPLLLPFLYSFIVICNVLNLNKFFEPFPIEQGITVKSNDDVLLDHNDLLILYKQIKVNTVKFKNKIVILSVGLSTLMLMMGNANA